MTSQNIQDFNKTLIENNEDILIKDYIVKINNLFYNIDISFIDDFHDLVDKDECCIPHEFLLKYGVSQLTAGSYDAKKILNNNLAIENKDYMVQVSQSAELQEQTNYILHPIIFKKILIRSRNTDKYADYYILLEKCIKYYNDYQLLKIKNKLNIICKDRVLSLVNQDKRERFVIVFRNETLINQYAVIRTQVKHLKDILRKIGYDESDIILNLPCCYANNLYNKVKEELKGHILFEKKYLFINEDGNCEEWALDPDQMEHRYNHVSITRNIGIVDISEEDFINKIHEIDSMRFDH